MSSAIPVLWSDDISVNVLSPIAILRAQIEPLRQKTKGILEGNIETITTEKGKVRHQFDLVAPALNGFRRRILTATHQQDLVYPVVIEAECFAFEAKTIRITPAAMIEGLRERKVPPSDALEEQERRAATEQEFIELVGKVLRSYQVRGLIQSMIARSNDQVPPSILTQSEEESPE
jgi:hypothetical protein